MRGQASVELLIILSVSLVALAAIVSFAYQEMDNAKTAENISKTQLALNSVADASEQVWSEGVGSQRLVQIDLPEGIAGERVFIDDHLLNIGVHTPNGVTDVNAYSKALLQGTLPNESGVRFVYVQAAEGFVFIGSRQLSITPATIVLQAPAGGSDSKQLLFRNTLDEEAEVQLTLDWTSAGASASVSETSFTVAAFSNYSVSVEATGGAMPGTYAGKVYSNASNESTEIDVVVYVY